MIKFANNSNVYKWYVRNRRDKQQLKYSEKLL